MKKGIFGCVGLLLLSQYGQAASLITTQGRSVTDPERFGAFGDNYAIYGYMNNHGWAERDEAALRARYSLGYILAGWGSAEDHNIIAFSQTGEFDFYMLGQRPSSPVLNRISNPAFHYVRYFEPRGRRSGGEVVATALGKAESPYGYSRIDIALEHESNGQVTEVRTAEEIERANVAYDEKDRHFFDSVSRGSNFLSFTGEISQRWEKKDSILPFRLTATLRLYLTQSYRVSWGPLAEKGMKLSDYNILRLAVHRYQRKVGVFGLAWTVGAGGLDKSSFDLDWQLDVFGDDRGWGFPLYIRYHNGPLNTLSNYSQRQDSFGVGVKLAMY